MAEREVKVTFKSQTKQLNDGVKEVTSTMQRMVNTGKNIQTVTTETKKLTDKMNGLVTVTKLMKSTGGKGLFGEIFGEIFKGVTAANLATGAIEGVFDLLKESVGEVVEFENSMHKLKQTMGLSTAETLGLKMAIFDVGMATGVAVKSLQAIAQGAWDASHDIAFVTKNLKFMAELSEQTGGDPGEIGKGMGEIAQETGWASDEIEHFLKTLTVFGREKGVKMNMKTLFPDIRNSLNTFKLMNPKASFDQYRKYFFETMWTGSPEAMNKAYLAMLKKGGVLAQLGFDLKKAIPDVGTVIEAIFRQHGNSEARKRFLGEVFGTKSIKDLQNLINNLEGLRKAEAAADPNNFGSEEPSLEKSLNKVNAAMLKIADSAFEKPLTDLAEQLSKLAMNKQFVDDLTSMSHDMGEFAVAALKAAVAVERLMSWFHKQGLPNPDNLWSWNPILKGATPGGSGFTEEDWKDPTGSGIGPGSFLPVKPQQRTSPMPSSLGNKPSQIEIHNYIDTHPVKSTRVIKKEQFSPAPKAMAPSWIGG